MGRYDRIDMDNVFYYDFDDTIKVKDFVEEMQERALENIDAAQLGPDTAWTEIMKTVNTVRDGVPDLCSKSYDYCLRHCFGSYGLQYAEAFQQTCLACNKCILMVERALPRGGEHDEAAKRLAKAMVRVQELEYMLYRDVVRDKGLINEQADRVNEAIAAAKKYDPSYSHPTAKRKGGCYVATAVYGSYDCPQVWTLRRYRDDTLAKSRLGRAFIRLYYAVSPTLVKWFGETAWFQKLFRGRLDRMVDRLREQGVADTPYEDLDW